MKKQKLLIVLMAATLPLLNVTSAAKLMFSWADTMIKNCPTEIEIYLDTEGEKVGSAGVNIIMNDENFIINDFNSNDGVFRMYTAPKKGTARKGKYEGKNFLRLIGSTSSANGYVWEWLFGKLTITSIADEVDLEFYIIPGYEGEDSNLATNKEWDIVDILTEVKNKKIQVNEWTCPIKALEPIEFSEEEVSVFVEKTKEKAEDTMEINEENIFDKSQETNWIKKNINYITIAIAIIIIIILLSLTLKKEKK